MKTISSLLIVGTFAALAAAAPSEASAQPGYYGPGGPPPNAQLPGGFHNRQGRLMFGFTGGLGGMNDDFGDIECDGCATVSGMISGRIGGFVGPRLALMFEAQLNGQQLSEEAFIEDDAFLYQTAAMIAAQYWLTPQLWIKGGIGLAHLQLESRDGFFSEDLSNGVAVMGALGFELFSARYMSVDLEGRVINGSYDDINNNITGATIGVGINWF